MSAKSSSSGRHSSPRAMPVETIITRFKSAQQKRQLREMDRSMSKVTELLKNPLKPKNKKKVTIKRDPKSNILSRKEDAEERKRSMKNVMKVTYNDETVEEHCPSNLKRNIVMNKISLKPKHGLKIIAQTNKRKRTIPKKGLFPQDYLEMQVDSDSVSRDGSPNAKRSRTLPHDMTMAEMIQLIEDSGSLNDEDLLEILTCPSPVWWEDPPDGYVEDALFTRPRSSAEMYPSIRSQLQENLQDRKRSNTPNVLSRREIVYGKRVSNTVDLKKKERVESINNNDIDLEISLSKCDEKFIKKRSKLESVLGNLKNKTCTNNDPVKIIMKPDEEKDVDKNSDSLSNKVSVIINLCSDPVMKADEKDLSSLKESESDKQASISIESDSECTDDDRLTDISFQDDALLNDLENMEIPMQQNVDASIKEETNNFEVNKNENTFFFRDVTKDDITEVAVPDFDERIDNMYPGKDNYTMSSYSFKTSTNIKERRIDPTYSDRESSIIEDYFEMKLFEEDVKTIVNKKHNKPSKTNSSTVQATPLKSKDDCEQIETNLTTSVIKFKNSDNTSINVVKIESSIPINLPPLKNSDKKKGNTGCVPENLPPLTRNPVIKLNSESPKSNKSTISFDTSESRSSLIQDNMDSISDTNICFLNEDDDDYCIEKKNEKTNEDSTSIIKSSHVIQTNEVVGSNNLNETLKYNDNKKKSTNELHFTQDNDLYKNFTQINGKELNDLDFQSLTITKVNDYNCCKVENDKRSALKTNKNDVSVISCDEIMKEQRAKTGETTTVESKICVENKLNTKVHDEIENVEKESDQCITIYKIVSDDSGNDEPKNDVIGSPEMKTKNLRNRMDSNESDSDGKFDDLIGKMESNKDKMVFYFKKCKNLFWKHKNYDKSDDKKGAVKDNELLANKKDITAMIDNKNDERVCDIESVKINSNKSSEDSTTTENNKGETNCEVNHNNNITNSDSTEQKCIIVSETKQIRYCMKCSSIFDTAQCNYCYKKNDTDKKSQCGVDYMSKMEKCFVCDVCRYKALSKDSLKRHILSHYCESKR